MRLALRPSFTRAFSQAAKAFGGKAHDPLRILFCGSDSFSTSSLEALNAIHSSKPSIVESVEVLCRPAKHVGRGLKRIRANPIHDYAISNDMVIHQVDDFAKWETPHPWDFNLIIAVSFGLFIPSRLIRATKYGGLNVHPSVLPDYAGAAPLHRMLINREKKTGMTLQTLDENRFDNGKIILQYTDINIPYRHTMAPKHLGNVLAPFGAKILTEGILHGDFVPPIEVAPPSIHGLRARKAPKITKEDRRIDWRLWTRENILVRARALGALWNEVRLEDGRVHRLIFSDIAEASSAGTPQLPVGTLFIWEYDHLQRLLVWTMDNCLLQISNIKLSGTDFVPARTVAKRLNLLEPYDIDGSGVPVLLKATAPLI
ncbi:MAG: Methionyl-tRNA formyltransferase [Vezdaea aestivalis]|nr:MAG: Methionyl-tRNA formyltransferase [Vezdaea aestivalis]